MLFSTVKYLLPNVRDATEARWSFRCTLRQQSCHTRKASVIRCHDGVLTEFYLVKWNVKTLSIVIPEKCVFFRPKQKSSDNKRNFGCKICKMKVTSMVSWAANMFTVGPLFHGQLYHAPLTGEPLGCIWFSASVHMVRLQQNYMPYSPSFFFQETFVRVLRWASIWNVWLLYKRFVFVSGVYMTATPAVTKIKENIAFFTLV